MDVIAIISRQIIQAEAGGYVCTHERKRERSSERWSRRIVEPLGRETIGLQSRVDTMIIFTTL